VPPLGSPAGHVVHIQVEGCRIARTGRILEPAGCTDRIDPEAAFPAAVAVAAAVLAVAAMEASVAVAGPAGVVAVVAEEESAVPAEAHPLAAEAFLFAVAQARLAAEKEVSAALAVHVEGAEEASEPAPGLERTQTANLLRSGTISEAPEFERRLDGFLPLALVLLDANHEAADKIEIAGPAPPAPLVPAAAWVSA